MQLNFGVGTAILKRTDVTLTKPALLGVLQDLEVDFAQTLKEATGAYKLPVDVAPGPLKITGKAKFLRIQADTLNQTFLGMTETASSGTTMSIAEQQHSASTSLTVSNGSTFVEDLGVFYLSTGVQLQPVASAPAAGQYVAGSVGVGTYTINSADESASANLLIYYSYTVSNLINIALSNQLMGTGPVFELNAQQNYTVAGVAKSLFLKLNACRSSKLSFPFKNTDYTIQDFEFQAFADASNNIGTWASTE